VSDVCASAGGVAVEETSRAGAGVRWRLVRAWRRLLPGSRVALAVAIVLALAHYAFGEWVFDRNPPFRRALNVWGQPAFWAEMPWVAAVPVLTWLGWVVVSLGRVNAARSVLMAYAVVLVGDGAWFLAWRHAARFGVKAPPDYWYWWTHWLPVALVIANAVIACTWWVKLRPRVVAREAARLGPRQLSLRAGAGVLASSALVLSLIYLVVPRLPVSGWTLDVANEFLAHGDKAADFQFILQGAPYHGTRLGALLEHVKLANLQRHQFYPSLDTSTFQQFVLSPVVDTMPVAELDWRRRLWEYFCPLVRQENDPSRAAVVIVRALRERLGISPNYPYRVGVETIWTQGMTDEPGFERVYVAALRSVGIGARLDEHKRAELLAAGGWQAAPRPVVEGWQ
jgi:hypothetical protein